MDTNIYAVYDLKAECYGKLFTCGTHGEAIRSFGTACKQADTTFNANPEDYRLHYLGTLNTKTGFMDPKIPAPEHLSSALDFVKK